MYTDGSCKNSGTKKDAMGIGVVIYAAGIQVVTYSDFAGFGTSNISEWEALLMGSILLKNFLSKPYVNNIKRIFVYCDSQVMVRIYNNEYKTNRFKKYYTDVKRVLRSIPYPLSVEWIPRNRNTVADKLSKINPKLSKNEWDNL